MTRSTRRIAALLFVIALAGLFLLSISLTDLQLEPGGPFPGGGASAVTAPATHEAPSQPGSAVIFEAVLGVIAVTLLVFLPRRLLGLFSARSLLWLLVTLTALILVLAILPRIAPGPAVLAADEAAGGGRPPAQSYTVSPLGRPPAAFAWLAATAIVLALALAAIVLLQRAPPPSGAAHAIAEQAQQALNALGAGRDFREVIIRYYIEMMEILRSAQHLERHQGMTAREYEDWLAAQGVPSAPIERLTSLFEKVRYGNEQAGAREEAAGRECLKEIVRFCRAQADR